MKLYIVKFTNNWAGDVDFKIIAVDYEKELYEFYKDDVGCGNGTKKGDEEIMYIGLAKIGTEKGILETAYTCC